MNKKVLILTLFVAIVALACSTTEAAVSTPTVSTVMEDHVKVAAVSITEGRGFEYAEIIPATVSLDRDYTYDRPGNPEEIVHLGQFVSSFILLSNWGQAEEAMKMVAPEARSELREIVRLIDTVPRISEVQFEDNIGLINHPDMVAKELWTWIDTSNGYGKMKRGREQGLKIRLNIIVPEHPDYDRLTELDIHIKPREEDPFI